MLDSTLMEAFNSPFCRHSPEHNWNIVSKLGHHLPSSPQPSPRQTLIGWDIFSGGPPKQLKAEAYVLWGEAEGMELVRPGEDASSLGRTWWQPSTTDKDAIKKTELGSSLRCLARRWETMYVNQDKRLRLKEKYAFTMRIIKLWKRLPSKVVASLSSRFSSPAWQSSEQPSLNSELTLLSAGWSRWTPKSFPTWFIQWFYEPRKIPGSRMFTVKDHGL